MDELRESIAQCRAMLEAKLHGPLAAAAEAVAKAWPERAALASALQAALPTIPHATFVYVLNLDGIQISDNVAASGLLPEHFGRDRSQRPYMKEAVPAHGFLLSHAYISLMGRRPSLTALQLIRDPHGEALGFLGADFDLRNLPCSTPLYREPETWRQVKGDPSIRGTLFQQTRTESLMDRNIDEVLAILDELIGERGVFQLVLHFSSSRATVWTNDDPYRYRLLTHDALTEPDVCLAFPKQPFPDASKIPRHDLPDLFAMLRALRFADDTIYLRQASLNLFNGMVSLTFSCDGSHYMRHHELLARSVEFWIGATG